VQLDERLHVKGHRKGEMAILGSSSPVLAGDVFASGESSCVTMGANSTGAVSAFPQPHRKVI